MFASGHPSNVVPIRYACDCPNLDKIALCMPLYRGGSLLDEIRRGPISPVRLLKIMHDVLNGLQKIHGVGLVHFDLKPSNVLFGSGGMRNGRRFRSDARGCRQWPCRFSGDVSRWLSSRVVHRPCGVHQN